MKFLKNWEMGSNRENQEKRKKTKRFSMAARKKNVFKSHSKIEESVSVIQIGRSKLTVDLSISSTNYVFESEYKFIPSKVNKWMDLLIKALKIMPNSALRRLGDDLDESYVITLRDDIHVQD